jgi:uncharacterized sulfatase
MRACRSLSLAACVAVAGLVLQGCPAGNTDTDSVAHDPAGRFNVVLIVSDDLNTELGCYGSTVVRSPNIDKLAAEGIRFDLTISQSPYCIPSRTSFISGRRPDTTGVWTNDTDPRVNMQDVEFLPEYFKEHGYVTAAFGKILAAHDEGLWDVYEALNDYSEDAPDKIRFEKKVRGNHRVLPTPTRNEDRHHRDGRIARRAVRFLEQHESGPLFLAVGFHAPHTPRALPGRYFDMYPLETIELPPSVANDREDWPSSFKPVISPNFEGMDDDLTRKARQAYFASITFMDAQVGVILDSLDRLDLADDTVVVFLSDHGYGIGEHGLYGKGTLFMNVSRVPLIISAPGKAPGVSTRPVELVSLYATLADLCGLPEPQGVEGRSLAPLLDDPRRPWSKYAYAYGWSGRSVISERFRYSEHHGSPDQAELYDHVNDPHEFHNLVGKSASASIVQEMRARLRGGWEMTE